MANVHYEGRYLEWKGWTADTFGAITALDRRYFGAEVRRTGITTAGPLRVLELGFGEGRFLAYAHERGWKATGTEMNTELVEVARRKGFDAVHADRLNTFGDGSFDLIAAFDVLEHLEAGALLEFLQELRRLLRPEGVLLARFPNGDSPFGLANQNGDFTHRSFIGSGKIEYLAGHLHATIVFLGGQAQPIRAGSLVKTAYRLVAIPLRGLINFAVRLLITPESRVPFCSTNMVVALRFDAR